MIGLDMMQTENYFSVQYVVYTCLAVMQGSKKLMFTVVFH